LDLVAAGAEVLKLGRSQRRLLFEGLDLQVNQLKNFSFDGGGWVRNHVEFSSANILADV